MNYGKKRSYAVLPSDKDRKDFFTSVLDMSTHKLKRDKPALVPVFKDGAQRRAFYNSAVARQTELNSILKGSRLGHDAKKNYRYELRAVNHLVDVSWGGYFGTGIGSKALYSLGGTPEKNPRVYVFGHGSPGSNKISKGTSVDDVAKMLEGMALPATSDVRVNSCWSAVGVDISDRRKSELQDLFQQGKLAEVSAPEKGFAAQLHARLKQKGFKGKTSGYIGSVSFGHDKVLLRNGTHSRHFGTTLTDDLVVRRSQTRVTFDD